MRNRFAGNIERQHGSATEHKKLISGKSDPGKTVEIRPSWTSEITKVEVDAKGNWIASIATPSASFIPCSISISDGEKVVLNNILIGEVWLASGKVIWRCR